MTGIDRKTKMPTDILCKKLFLSHYKIISLVNTTPHSHELTAVTTGIYDVTKRPYDVLFVHTFSTEEMKRYLYDFWEMQAITEGGRIYLVYPKVKQAQYKGIHRDTILKDLSVDELGYVPNTYYKFVRMVNLNEIFTIIGVKYVPIKQKTKE